MNERDAALLQQAAQAVHGGDVDRARSIGHDLRSRHPRDARVLGLLGEIAFADGDLDAAAAMLTRCASIEPRNPRPHLTLGELRTHQGRFKEALARYEKVLKLRPDDPSAIAGKADAFERKGDRAKACAVLRPWIEQGRHTAAMSVVQSRLDLHEERYDDVIRLVNGHLLRGDAPTFAHWHLCFLLGQACERSGRADEAFDAYRRAHDVIPARFDAGAWAALTTQLIDTFSRERIASLPRSTTDSARPIFIVGMPRSGSTLVERILAAHPQVHGAGETPALQVLVNALPERLGALTPYPGCVDAFDAGALDRLARSYLDAIGRQGSTAQRITDKFLSNYRHVGLIGLMLPRATVLHCRRDPVDTCLSCYTQPLMPNAHPYASDLATLGVAYRDYDRLMRHWQDALDEPPVEVQYESLVKEPESQTRRLLEVCGLPWDDACLRFHESRRSVQTASYDQVNRSIYTTSVGRAERFGAHLDPLRAALSGGAG